MSDLYRVPIKQGLHVMELEYRNGFRKTDPRYGVAERFTQNRLACRYCGALDSLNGEWQDEGRAAVYQGISWSSERMRKFERDGIIVDWQGFR